MTHTPIKAFYKKQFLKITCLFVWGKNTYAGAREMPQQLRAFAAFAEDLHSHHHMVAHNHLFLQIQGIQQALLASMGTR